MDLDSAVIIEACDGCGSRGGSPQKIEVLIMRYQMGLALFDKNDNSQPEWSGYSSGRQKASSGAAAARVLLESGSCRVRSVSQFGDSTLVRECY